MATHSSILARKIPQTEEPGRLWFIRSQRIRHMHGRGTICSQHLWSSGEGLHIYYPGLFPCVCVGGGMWGGGKGEAFASVRKLQTGTQRASCCYNRVLEQTNAIKAKNVCEADTDRNRKPRGGVHLSLITSH